MRVWKLEACRDEDRIGCRWGYALTDTEQEAIELTQNTSGLPFNWVHEKHPDMIWPGAPDSCLDWSS
jgi:hypothetical protein